MNWLSSDCAITDLAVETSGSDFPACLEFPAHTNGQDVRTSLDIVTIPTEEAGFKVSDNKCCVVDDVCKLDEQINLNKVNIVDANITGNIDTEVIEHVVELVVVENSDCNKIVYSEVGAAAREDHACYMNALAHSMGEEVAPSTSIKEAPTHPGLHNGNADWFRVISPKPDRVEADNLICSLWVVDRDAGVCADMWIDVFDDCLIGICGCRHVVGGGGCPDKTMPSVCRVVMQGGCRPRLGVCVEGSMLWLPGD